MAFSNLRFKVFGNYPQNLNRSTTKRLVRRLGKNEQATITHEREVDELETRLMLSPDDDAPDAPNVLSVQRQRQLFITVAAGIVFVVAYGSGTLHM